MICIYALKNNVEETYVNLLSINKFVVPHGFKILSKNLEATKKLHIMGPFRNYNGSDPHWQDVGQPNWANSVFLQT